MSPEEFCKVLCEGMGYSHLFFDTDVVVNRERIMVIWKDGRFWIGIQNLLGKAEFIDNPKLARTMMQAIINRLIK